MATVSPRLLVVCLDESEDSFLAWTWSVQNLIRQGDKVVLLTVAVMDTSLTSDYSIVALAADDIAPGVIDEAALEAARQMQMEKSELFMNLALTQAQEDIKSIGNVQIEGKILTQNGSIGETVVSYLQGGHLETEPSIVICGSRGLGAFKRAVLGAIGMGSASDYMCHHLHIPVRQSPKIFPHCAYL
jgi:hypothetical protein